MFPDKRNFRASVWGASALLLAALVGYARALTGGFIWDDVNYIVNNPVVTGADGLKKIWFTAQSPDFWPVSYTALWAEWQSFGANETAFHVVNVTLHALNAWLIWRILKRLGFRWAFWIALIFCVHPVNAEAVAWIFQTKTTLASALALASWWFYFRFEDRGQRKFYAGSLALFVAALLAKTSVVTWPLVLAGYLTWKEGGLTRKSTLRLAPFFLASLVIGFIGWRWYIDPLPVPPSEIVRDDSFLSRLAIAGLAVWFYIGKLFWPKDLAFVYPRWEINASDWINYVPVAALGVLFAVLCRYRKSWAKPWLLGLAYFVVVLFPALGFVNIYFMRFSLVADHYQYLAELGIIAVVIELAGRRLGETFAGARVPHGLFAAISCLLLALTFVQSGIYLDEETIWRDTLTKNPSAWMAHNSLGLVLKRRGDFVGALGEYDQAIQLKPTAQSYYNVGMIRDAQSRPQDSLRAYEKAAELNPYADNVRTNWGAALLKVGRPNEAEVQLREALKLNPSAQNFYNFGFVSESQGRTREASDAYRKALQLEPGSDLFRQALERLAR